MPSVTSLEKQEYYGFKHNRFWTIMAHYFHCNLDSYEDKKHLILQNHMILWDVIHSCEREGSLDSKIKHEVLNDIGQLVNTYQSIRYVICNGKKAYALYMRHFQHLGLSCISLPSTSNANRTIKEKDLYHEWELTLHMIFNKKEN